MAQTGHQMQTFFSMYCNGNWTQLFKISVKVARAYGVQ